MLFDYKRQCPEDCVPGGKGGSALAIPVVSLIGVSHTGSSSVVVKIEGDIPAELAQAMAEEVFANLGKADFSSGTAKGLS